MNEYIQNNRQIRNVRDIEASHGRNDGNVDVDGKIGGIMNGKGGINGKKILLSGLVDRMLMGTGC